MKSLEIIMIPVTDQQKAKEFHGIIIETDDIALKIEELKAKDIRVENMHETPWGKFAWLKDIDGNSLCLHQK